MSVTKYSHPALPEGWELPEEYHNGSELLENLWHEILIELTDREYRNRTHGSRRTLESGCIGPLCKRSLREYSRRRTKGVPNGRYKYLDPIIAFFEAEAMRELEEAERAALQRLSKLF